MIDNKTHKIVMKSLGDDMAKVVNGKIVYGLDDEAITWHRREMLAELEAIMPFPKGRYRLKQELQRRWHLGI